MGSNFNVVQKPKKEEKKEEDDLELEDDLVQDKSNNKDARKKLFKMMGIIVGVMVLLLVVLFIASLFSNRNYSFDKIEKVLTDAATSYFKDFPDSLPASDGDVVEIDVSNLIQAGKMKDLTKKGVVCSASVQVENAGGDYLYTPYLNCGDSYTTVPLSKKVMENNEVVTSGYGLYSINGVHHFRGEEVDNYVQLDKSLWRIVKITQDGNVVLISEDGMLKTQPWDDRYNEKVGFDTGFNVYANSRVKEYLDKAYKNPSESDGELLLSDSDKNKLVSYNLCVGRRAMDFPGTVNSEECSETVKVSKYGLLTLADYIIASVDGNCQSAATKSCQNYNYLVNNDISWWLATGDKADNSNVYYVEDGGYITSQYANDYRNIRPVVYLNSNVLYKSGKGTIDDPYKIK